MIFMPYCTGDGHLGTNAGHDYGDGIVINHTGYLNGLQGFDEVVTTTRRGRPDLVTGSSASTLSSPDCSDALPDAEILGLRRLPEHPARQRSAGWGAPKELTMVDHRRGKPIARNGHPGRLYPTTTPRVSSRRSAGRFDHAYDGTQASFSALAGLDGFVTAD